jgi:hypothetical protein
MLNGTKFNLRFKIYNLWNKAFPRCLDSNVVPGLGGFVGGF